MTRVTLAGTAAPMILLVWTATASAELRTGLAPNMFPDRARPHPPARELQRADVRYDYTAGTLAFT